MWPIFIFGTGRCASTHIQRVITLSTDCWIWGEHDGFLGPLLESVNRCETSPGLERSVFAAGARSDDQIIADMTAGSERLSWLNRFDKSEFKTEITGVLDRLFRSRIPAGWTEWGFKEILYGLDNQAPELLLSLFPDATAAFTFRDPQSTIASMIRTWSPELLAGPRVPDEFSRIYNMRARRWRNIMTYFLNHRECNGRRIAFISPDKLQMPVTRILGVLGLSSARALPADLHVTNRGLSNWPEWAENKFADLFLADRQECLDLFMRARSKSDMDFAVEIADSRPGVHNDSGGRVVAIA